jgi:adenosine deaminase
MSLPSVLLRDHLDGGNSHDSEELARLALQHRYLGVVGFDIAGPEAGFPPQDHLAAFRLACIGGLRLTIHAGESGAAGGVAYIAAAMDRRIPLETCPESNLATNRLDPTSIRSDCFIVVGST